MKYLKYSYGFTLIELLIVIAVIGILASTILAIINPLEQFARGRDAGRKSAVKQFATAMGAYYIVRDGSFPPATTTWIDNLKVEEEISGVPGQLDYSGSIVPCTTNNQNNFCYNTDFTNAIIFTVLESALENSKCNAGSNEVAYFLWASLEGQTGVICSNSEPSQYSGYSFLP